LKRQRIKQHLHLTPVDNRRLADLCGQFDENLREVERHLDVEIKNRGHTFHLSGDTDSVHAASEVITDLYAKTKTDHHLTADTIHLYLQTATSVRNKSRKIKEPMSETPVHTIHKNHTHKKLEHKHSPFESDNAEDKDKGVQIHTPELTVKAHGKNQLKYLQNIYKHDINFAVGPAGTGKTFLAVACAVEALAKENVRRILLVRPAVEAGERLGFLPGDLSQKVDPYLRPLYDALYEMLGFERVMKLLERHVIEIAPLAYMRGRTLNDSFIILDESQNTTKEQMKMFLTRIGFSSVAVITGDVTQVDLPKGVESGLTHALVVLKDLAGISLTHFENDDVVRHPLVQSIVAAYDTYEKKRK
jgi:phosphate starvation-inducible protein PhoH and related proteins